jgi:rhodanese-related sulfurtransferase
MKLRVARHTDNLEKIIRFYQLLGLENLGSFTNHDGYDGVFLGIKNESWHLEFTTSQDAPFHEPDEDDLLVFYCKSAGEKQTLVKKLSKAGIPFDVPKNPYWKKNGTLLRDPDGFGIILTVE